MIPTTDALSHPGWYIAITALLAMVPVILGTTTSYLKLSMALGVLRNGFGAQQVPNNMIVMVLSLVLSLFIMQPVAEQIAERFERLPKGALAATSANDLIVFGKDLLGPWRDFLKQHAGEREVTVLSNLGKGIPESDIDASGESIPLRILIPAFVLTEMKEGLMIGCMLLLPFLVIDLAIANILAGLGMYMMSPTIISLPLKLLLFISVDGWLLISRGLIASYGGSV